MRIGYLPIRVLITYPYVGNLSAKRLRYSVFSGQRPPQAAATRQRTNAAPSRLPERRMEAAAMHQRAEAVGREAEQAIAHPIGEGADIEEQEHRCQETR